MGQRAQLLLVHVFLLLGMLSCSGAGRTPAPGAPGSESFTGTPTSQHWDSSSTSRAFDIILEAGRQRVAAGDLAGAEAAFRDALALDPRSGRAYAALSRLHLDETGREAEATSEAQDAVRLAPNDVSGWVALTYALGRQLRGAEALEAAQKAAKLDERSASALAALSYAYLLDRRPTEAIAAARRRGRVGPELTRSLFSPCGRVRIPGRFRPVEGCHGAGQNPGAS